jgi:mannosyl-oligosaccharide alpha-1,2-mannosidase
MFDNTLLILVSEHLACFDGGNFLLGGEVLGRQDYIDYGLALVNGCHDTYTSTATGIGPEVFSWDPNSVPADQSAFFQANGFYITNSIYDLRFVAINATTRANSGFSEIENVNAPGGGAKDDFQESFWFAEVMKYAYIIHAPDAEWQVNSGGKNKWVFNTEAHPLKVHGPPI